MTEFQIARAEAANASAQELEDVREIHDAEALEEEQNFCSCCYSSPCCCQQVIDKAGE